MTQRSAKVILLIAAHLVVYEFNSTIRRPDYLGKWKLHRAVGIALLTAGPYALFITLWLAFYTKRSVAHPLFSTMVSDVHLKLTFISAEPEY